MEKRRFEEILERLEKLERIIFADTESPVLFSSKKTVTLPELARNKKILNGQERIAVIVGFFEKIERKEKTTIKEIENAWVDSKFPGKFHHTLLGRAIEKGLVRGLKKGNYDLTQSGEDFFAKFFPQ